MVRNSPTRVLSAVLFVGASLLFPTGSVAAQAPEDVAPGKVAVSTVFLVRHAEKATDDPVDPTLTEAGVARAEELARILADAGIDRVFSTDFIRTVETARPTAEALGVEIELYDPRNREAVEALVEMLRSEAGRYLVVGHSNTTPGLVRALGGDPVSPIDEDEYDRLYIVHPMAEGEASASILLRFGASSGETGSGEGSE